MFNFISLQLDAVKQRFSIFEINRKLFNQTAIEVIANLTLGIIICDKYNGSIDKNIILQNLIY